MTELLQKGWEGLDGCLGHTYEDETAGGSQRIKALPLLITSGMNAEVTVVDEEPTRLWLHHLPHAKAPVACLKGMAECTYCKLSPRRLRCVFTVVDHRDLHYRHRGKNASVKDMIRYLVCSPDEALALKKAVANDGKQIAGSVLRVARVRSGRKVVCQFELLDRNPELHQTPEFTQRLDFEAVFGIVNQVNPDSF